MEGRASLTIHDRQEQGTIRLEESPIREVCSIQSEAAPDVPKDVSDEKKALL